MGKSARNATTSSFDKMEIGTIIVSGPNKGMVYAGLSAGGQHHLLVEPEDVKAPDGNRSLLSFDEAAAVAMTKGMFVFPIRDMALLAARADKIGGFDPNGRYWSSSIDYSKNAWIQKFSGIQSYGRKDLGNYVRCGRRPPIEPLSAAQGAANRKNALPATRKKKRKRKRYDHQA